MYSFCSFLYKILKSDFGLFRHLYRLHGVGYFTFAIDEDKLELEKTKLDERQLKDSFKKAKAMLKSGCLANRREIIERYINQVKMLPQSIEISFNLAKNFIINERLDK